ncbi:MAG: ZIP family metal transporter [Burkholderiales bacterium]
MFWIIAATFVGGALSLLAAALLSYTLLSAWVPRMVSYAVGALLAAAFLDLLPEAFNSEAAGQDLFAVVMGGIFAFFVLEKAALWRHRHAPQDGHRHSRAGTLILIGDGVHNFIDGILIAAAFLISPAVGVATTLAIVAHEIPQEIGDFMVLLASGYSRARALAFNLLSSLAAVAGGLVGYFMLERAEVALPYVLALAAASFIYIAVADLIPDLHKTIDTRGVLLQFLLIGVGVATIVASHAWLHHH